MAGNNPYAAPKANLDRPDSGGIDTTSPFSPKGRFARSTYIAYSFGMTMVAWLLLAILAGILGATGLLRGNADFMMNAGTKMIAIMAVGYVALLVVITIFGIRRLHDLNWSGWWIMVTFIPSVSIALGAPRELLIINFLLAVPMLFFRGTAEPNKYGPPRPARTLHVVLAWAPVVVMGILAAIAIPAYQDYTQRAKAAAQSASQPPAVEQPQGQRP